jgi:hypothetical protein
MLETVSLIDFLPVQLANFPNWCHRHKTPTQARQLRWGRSGKMSKQQMHAEGESMLSICTGMAMQSDSPEKCFVIEFY